MRDETNDLLTALKLFKMGSCARCTKRLCAEPNSGNDFCTPALVSAAVIRLTSAESAQRLDIQKKINLI
jgi:hypothetical protein